MVWGRPRKAASRSRTRHTRAPPREVRFKPTTSSEWTGQEYRGGEPLVPERLTVIRRRTGLLGDLVVGSAAAWKERPQRLSQLELRRPRKRAARDTTGRSPSM